MTIPVTFKSEKTIYVSDIHLNVEEAYTYTNQEQTCQISWIGRKRVARFNDFLQWVATQKEVKNLVILGDLCDNWIWPTNKNPQSIADVIAAPTNQPVMQTLKSIAEGGTISLFYVPGNHDMFASASDIAKISDKIIYCSKSTGGGEFIGKYRLIAQHGHQYTMMNAVDPVTITNPPGAHHVPSGYAVGRCVGSARAIGIAPGTGIDAFTPPEKANEDLTINAIKDIIETAAILGATWFGNPPVLMNRTDGYGADPNIQTWADDYQGEYDAWPTGRVAPGYDPMLVSASDALTNDMVTSPKVNDLLLGAYPQLITPGKARVVIFGHTHEAGLFSDRSHVTTTNPTTPSANIYGNTGSWVDAVETPTFIETRDTGAALVVSLYGYPDDGSGPSLQASAYFNTRFGDDEA